jgi:adenylate kinase
VVLFLNMPDEELVVRNSGRRACRACGVVYHVISHPPAREGVCDACGGELAQRDDDREEVVRHRLSAYRGNADELLALYKGRGILRQVNGVGTQDEVYQRLREAIRSVKR